MRHSLVVVLVLVGCAEPKPPPGWGQKPITMTPAAPTVVTKVVIVESRVSGHLTTTTNGNAISAVYHVVQNGRGPHVEATLTLAPDATIATFSATGHHTLGTPIAETFTRSAGRATWKSTEETGDVAVSGPAFFVPMAELPVTGLLATAALRAGGTLALLPAGKVTVEKVAELTVSARGLPRQLIGYSLTGLGFAPSYTWFDAGDGRWFGDVESWSSVIPEGWESAIEPIIARQNELDNARSATLAQTAAHRPPAAGLAYTHARVLDVVAGRWLADQTVVIVGDTITAIGPRAAIPPGAEVVDLAGKALLPGLVDMHTHLQAYDAVLDIASGVTTVRDVGNDPDKLDDMKQRIDGGTAVGPRIVRMGFIEGRNEKAAASKVTAETVEEATAAVELFARRGYEGIKIYNSVKPELVPVLTAAAHARGMLVTGHVPVHMLANEVVRAGYDGLEHINMLALNFFATHETDTRDTTRFTLVGDNAADFDLAGKPFREFAALLVQKKTVVTPTLVVFEDLFTGVPGTVTPGIATTVARLPLQVQRWFLTGGLPMPGDKHARFVKSWDKLLAMVKALWQAKVHLTAGTDHINGLMLHHELELFVRAGIPAAAVLRIATLDAARAIKLDKKLGSITVGKAADLVVVDGDPLADIRTIARVVSTMRGGVVFASEPLYRAVGVTPAQ